MWRSNRGCSPQHRRVTASSDARAEHLSSPDADQMGVLVAASHERRCAGDRLSGLVLLTRSRDASHPAAIPLHWAPVVSLPTVDIAETFGEAGWTGAESGWVLATCWRSSCVPQKIGGRCPCRQQVALGLRSSPCFDCDPHRVPGETCSCGFYAMKSLDALREPNEVNVILGKIAMAGK